MYALSFSDNTLILISENTPLLIKIAEKQWILTNNHSYKYSTANQWITHWFLFRNYRKSFYISEMNTHMQKNIIVLLRKVIAQFTFLLLVIVIFNKEFFLDNNLKIYSSQILEKFLFLCTQKKNTHTLFKNITKFIEEKSHTHTHAHTHTHTHTDLIIWIFDDKSNFNLIFLIELRI